MRKALITLATVAAEFCVKYGKGMSQKQIEAFYTSEADRLRKIEAQRAARDDSPGYKNCMREYDDAKRLGEWLGKPNQADCIAWAEAVRQKGIDMIDEGLKGLMETK